jgi:hypothetical protein
MKFPTKSEAKLPAEVGEIGAQMGVKPGMKMSIRNMAKATPGAKKKRPKPGTNPHGGYTYA